MFENIIRCWTLLVVAFYFETSSSTQFTHDRKRVGPLDLVMAEHSCLKKFTVNENTIIRTQDSRLLGAKFLNESDIGNREDCLTFCCNTPYCDIAVFQEKKPFSCYLFDCGPPDDFVCKFTSHSYYTSAVLAVNRHQLDLGVWSSQFQHEAELTDLRPGSEKVEEKDASPKKSSAPPTPSNVEPATTTTSTTTLSTTTSTPTKPQNLATKALCSKFQFGCRNGECIAIYNVCDGIPQCPDGSDEAEELECPPRGSQMMGSQLEAGKSNRGSTQEDLWNNQSSQRRKYGPERGIFNAHPSILEYNRYQNDPSPDYTREEGLGYGGHGKGPGYYDYNQRPPQGATYMNSGHPDPGSGGDSGSVYHHEYSDYALMHRPHEVPQISPPVLRQQAIPALQPNSGAPNGASLRGPSQQMYPQQPQDMTNGQRWQGSNPQFNSYPVASQTMPQQASHYIEPLRDNFQQGFDPGRTSHHQSIPSGRGAELQGGRQQPPYPQTNQEQKLAPHYDLINTAPQGQYPKKYGEGLRNNPSVPQQTVPVPIEGNRQTQVDPSSTSNGKGPPPKAPTGMVGPSAAGNQTQSRRQGGEASQTSGSAQEEAKATPPAQGDGDGTTGAASGGDEKQEMAPHDPIIAHASLSRLVVDLEELEREEEGQKAQTSGAILALSLGMCITALLIVLVGCRIRGVKRRARRRRGLRSPLEHDADYLVNGMYL